MNIYTVYYRTNGHVRHKNFHKMPGEQLDINTAKQKFIWFYPQHRETVFKIRCALVGKGGVPDKTYRYENGI